MTSWMWFRRLLAWHQIIYLLNFWPQPWQWFSPNQMVIPEITFPSFPSLLSTSWSSPLMVNCLWFALLIGWTILGIGRLPRWGQFLLFFLQISFHNANVLIIHEPQQMANFFLIASLLGPMKSGDPAQLPLKRIMVACASCYYFLAGLKKLPDPNWLSGEALNFILHWQPLAQQNLITELLTKNSALSSLATWSTLFFELTFPLSAFSRYRLLLIPIGACFHVLIASTLEVGTFGWIMAPWYAFLLKDTDSQDSLDLNGRRSNAHEDSIATQSV